MGSFFQPGPGQPYQGWPGQGQSYQTNNLFSGRIPGSNQITVPPLDPGLTSQFFNWLQGQVGQGATPYGGQAWLPSSGQTLGAGDLTAPLNEYLASLQNFFQTGQAGSMPGFGTLQQMSESGLPVDVLPAWQAMVQAQQRNIGQGAANLREQFAFAGNLAGSPFGTAEADYQNQAILQQNALLQQGQQQALEAARGRQFGASQFLGGAGLDMADYLQGLDQASIDRAYQEFIRTQPEYSPLLQALMAASTTFPPTVKRQSRGIGWLGGVLGGSGSILQGLGALGLAI